MTTTDEQPEVFVSETGGETVTEKAAEKAAEAASDVGGAREGDDCQHNTSPSLSFPSPSPTNPSETTDEGL